MFRKKRAGQFSRFAGGQEGGIVSWPDRPNGVPSYPSLAPPHRPAVRRPDPTGLCCVRVLDSTRGLPRISLARASGESFNRHFFNVLKNTRRLASWANNSVGTQPCPTPPGCSAGRRDPTLLVLCPCFGVDIDCKGYPRIELSKYEVKRKAIWSRGRFPQPFLIGCDATHCKT